MRVSLDVRSNRNIFRIVDGFQKYLTRAVGAAVAHHTGSVGVASSNLARSTPWLCFTAGLWGESALTKEARNTLFINRRILDDGGCKSSKI